MNITDQQQLSKSQHLTDGFTVQFTSPSVQRKVNGWFPGSRQPHHRHHTSGQGVSSNFHPAAATDSTSSNRDGEQKNYDAFAAACLHQANQRDLQGVKRRPKDELHYLKTLVCAGLLYQRRHGSFESLIAKICGASSRAVSASAPGTCSVVTAFQAANLDFVAETMCTDVEYMLAEQGYTKTLKALIEMQLWHC